MENNSVDIIKKTEEDLELEIKKKREDWENKKNERIKFWQEKEKEVIKEYQFKKENIVFELGERFSEIDHRLLGDCRKKKEVLKNSAKKNFENFKEEVFKRL
ncbi:MAG: hypothetical protein FJZ07_00655 [Candidatus Nealsonbacteria bacterium]|nr:hypothetical protein [Candidatus Nealsonbacteria bacterium]